MSGRAMRFQFVNISIISSGIMNRANKQAQSAPEYEFCA